MSFNNNELKTSIKEQRKLKLRKQKLGMKMDYECPQEGCGKKFKQFNSLDKHLRVHTGERPYKCTFEGCTKAFTQISNLKRHQKIHSGLKPYQCIVCLKNYVTLSNLEQHKQVHLTRNNRKVFQCPAHFCQKTFYHKCSLNKHVARVHGSKAADYYMSQNPIKSSVLKNNDIFSKFSLLVKQEMMKIEETSAVIEQKELGFTDFYVKGQESLNASTADMSLTQDDVLSQISDDVDFNAVGVEFESLFEDIGFGNKRKASVESCDVEPEVSKFQDTTEKSMDLFNYNNLFCEEKNQICFNELSQEHREPANELFSSLFDNSENFFASETVPQTFFESSF